MIDLHQHILWGIDDGPKRPEEMYAMLRKAHQQGIRCIAATPHVNPGFEPFDMQIYLRKLRHAQEYCDRNRLGITMVAGAEAAWTYNTVEALCRGQIPTLNRSEYVLIELWETVGWNEVETAVKKLQRAGFTPILAHVERYWCFKLQPGRALALKEELDVGYQINAASILEPGGFLQKRLIERLLMEKAVDVVASDAHDCEERPACLAEVKRLLEARCGAKYAHMLLNFNGVMRG